MNEEQNKQNIPAPMPPENNIQNISPVNRWQIKSWHVGFLPVLIIWIFCIFEIVKTEIECSQKYCDTLVIGIYVFILGLMIIAIIPATLLVLRKTRKFGAIISILIGFYGIEASINFNFSEFFRVEIIFWVLYLLAGLIFFVREEKISLKRKMAIYE